MFSKAKRVRDASFPFLISVLNMLQSEFLSVIEQTEEVAGILSAGNNHDVPDARVHQRLKRVVDHRKVEYRQQVLVGYFGEGKKPGPDSASKDYTFHAFILLRILQAPIFCLEEIPSVSLPSAPARHVRWHALVGSERPDTTGLTGCLDVQQCDPATSRKPCCVG